MFQSIQDTRPFFFDTWKKHQQALPLTPLETQLIDVILAHPEYHAVLNHRDDAANRTYFAALGDTNPFLHMGLHLAVREQVATNRPPGITKTYQTLKTQLKSAGEAEHLLMRCLEDALWLAQQNNMPPDEAAYLKACMALT